jgi:hypothetical protein
MYPTDTSVISSQPEISPKDLQKRWDVLNTETSQPTNKQINKHTNKTIPKRFKIWLHIHEIHNKLCYVQRLTYINKQSND